MPKIDDEATIYLVRVLTSPEPFVVMGLLEKSYEIRRTYDHTEQACLTDDYVQRKSNVSDALKYVDRAILFSDFPELLTNTKNKLLKAQEIINK